VFFVLVFLVVVDLLGVVLGDGLGALRDGVLGQLAGERQTDGSLDLARRDRALLVVARQTAGLGRQTLKDVVHKVVHDDHALLRDAGVGVHLLEHLVDVGGVRVGAHLARAVALLVVARLLGLDDLLLATRGGLAARRRCCSLTCHL
jgi:hypothetical protein